MQAVRAVTEQLGSTNAMVDSLRRDLAQYQAKIESGAQDMISSMPPPAPGKGVSA